MRFYSIFNLIDVIATDNNTVVINEGSFETATVSYTSSKDDIYLGEALSVRLINPNLNDGNGFNEVNGVEVNFDNVELSAASVPEFTSIINLLALGLIGTSSLMYKKIG